MLRLTFQHPSYKTKYTVITPNKAPLEPGTTFVLPPGASLPTASPLPPSLQAGRTSPAAAATAKAPSLSSVRRIGGQGQEQRRQQQPPAARPASVPLPDRLPDATPRELLYVHIDLDPGGSGRTD